MMISSLQPLRRITVTLRREDFPTWLPFTTGVVLVDGRRSGILIGGRSRTFHVSPGEHTIGVVLDHLHRLETEPLRMEEGDRIDLVCGRGPRRLRFVTPVSILLASVSALAVGMLILNGIAPRWIRLAQASPGNFGVVAALAVVLATAALTRWNLGAASPYLRRRNDKKKTPLAVDL